MSIGYIFIFPSTIFILLRFFQNYQKVIVHFLKLSKSHFSTIKRLFLTIKRLFFNLTLQDQNPLFLLDFPPFSHSKNFA